MQLLRPALLALAFCAPAILANDDSSAMEPLDAQNRKDVSPSGLEASAGASVTGDFQPFEGFAIGCGVNANVTQGILGGGINAGAKSMMYELGGGFSVHEHNVTIGLGAVLNGTVGNVDLKIQPHKTSFILTASGNIQCGAPFPASKRSVSVICTASDK